MPRGTTWRPLNARRRCGGTPPGRPGWPRRRRRSPSPAAIPARRGSGCRRRPPSSSGRPAARRRTLPPGPQRDRRAGGSRPATVAHRSGRRCEQLEGDVVRVAERQARTVARVLDLAVGHAQRVQAGGPFGQLGAARAAERERGRGRACARRTGPCCSGPESRATRTGCCPAGRRCAGTGRCPRPESARRRRRGCTRPR